MEERILALIYNYSFGRKLADVHFIDELIEIVVCSKDLHSYLAKGIEYYEKTVKSDDEMMTVTRYYIIDRFMSINTSAMIRRLEKYQKHASKFNDYERLFYNNLLVSQVILHELEHVEQNRKYNSFSYDTETLLCKMGFHDNYMYGDISKVYINLQDQGWTYSQIQEFLRNRIALIQGYYKYSPTERLADIKSYHTLKMVLADVKKEVPNLYRYEHYNYLKKMVSGYENVPGLGLVSPTLIYANGLGYSEDLLKFPFYDNDPNVMNKNLFEQYSLQERLSFGLPITNEEHENVNKILEKNNRFE